VDKAARIGWRVGKKQFRVWSLMYQLREEMEFSGAYGGDLPCTPTGLYWYLKSKGTNGVAFRHLAAFLNEF